MSPRIHFLAGFLALLSFTSISTALNAQKIIGDPITKQALPKMPLSYKNPKGKIEGLSTKREEGIRPWIVYSDRENNYTYLGKNCDPSQKNVSLSFLDALIVVQETEDAVRVIRYDPSDSPVEEKHKQLYSKPTASDLGWIKKRNLLLWRNAMVNDSTDYTIKAISVKRIDDKNDIKEILRRGILSLYNYPEENKLYDAKRDISLFQYFFVLKVDKEKDMYLLSTKNNLVTSSVQEDVLGWAPRRKIHVWDNGLCLRVNFNQDAIQERKEKRIKVSFFKSPDDARNFRDGKPATPLPFNYTDPSASEEGLNTSSDNPYLYGFPIIGQVQKESNIFKTGYVTNTMDKNGNSIFSARRTAEYNQIFREIVEQVHKVNVIFVLDGAYRASMFKTLSGCINDIAYFGGDGRYSRNEYKLGAVIYNSANCEEPIKLLKLTSALNKENFTDRLYSESMSTACVVERDKTGAPNYYDALLQACNMFDNNKTTNLIIVVGGTSTRDKTQRPAALKALIDKQVRMNFIQVQSKNGENYDAFLTDSRFLLTNCAQEFDKKYFRKEIVEGKRKPVELQANETSAFLENSGIPGSIYWKEIGGYYKGPELKAKIQALISDNESKMNNLIQKYEQGTTGAEKGVNENDEAVNKQLLAYLKEKGISEEDAEQLATEQNYQIFIEGYTTLIHKDLTQEILSRTLFMSRDEFEKLYSAFRGLEEATWSPGETRSNMVNRYIDIINAYKGGNMATDELSKWPLDRIYNLITTLPETNNKLFKKTLKDLKDEKKTPDEELSKIKNQFNQINKKLASIKKNPLYRKTGEDDDFFWVPDSAFKIQ